MAVQILESRIYYGWIIAGTLGFCAILAQGATQFFYGVLVVPLEAQFGWSRAAIAGAYSCGFVVAALLALPVGRWVDRHGARTVMTVGSLVSALAFLGLTRVNQLWQLYLAWGLGVGVAMALTLYTVAFTVITNWFYGRQGAALGLVTLMGGLAAPLTVPAAGSLIDAHGWRFTAAVVGIAFVVVNAPLQALLLRRRPEDHGLVVDGGARALGGVHSPLPSGLTLRQALKSVAFWTLTVSSFCATVSWTALIVHQIAYMVWRGHDPLLAAWVVGLLGLVSLPGRLLFNLLGDLLGAQAVLALAQACQGVGVVVLVLAPTPAWLVVYALVFGVAMGTGGPLRAATMARQFGRRAYGSITAAAAVLISISAGLGPLLTGWLFDRTQSYLPALWLCAGVLGLAAVLVLVTPAPRPSPPGQRSEPSPTDERASESEPALDLLTIGRTFRSYDLQVLPSRRGA